MIQESSSSKRKVLSVLRGPMFFWSLPFAFLSFALPIYSKELGASALEIGGLFSTFTATTLLLRPLIGWAVDRFGRKQFLLTAFALYALSMIMFAAADGMGGLYVSRFVQGVGSSLLWISVNTIVSDLSDPGQLGKALGKIDEITARGSMVGGLVGFTLISILPEAYGWQLIFFSFSVLTVLAALLALKRVPETRQPAEQKGGKSKQPLSPLLMRLLVVIFVTGLSEAMLGPIFLIFLQDHFTSDIGTLAFAYISAGLVYGFLGGRLGSLSDRFGRVKMMAVGLAGAGLLSIALPNLPTVIWLAVFYALNAAAWATSEPAEAALVSEYSGQKQRGLGYGLHDFAGNLGATIGPLLGGWLYDHSGQAVPFYLNGGVLLFCAFWTIILLKSSVKNKELESGIH